MTQLPLPVTLNNGEWEVGLVDLIYPHTWYNIRNDNNIFGFDVGNGELLVRRVPPGCYETVPDILKGMHLELHQNKIEFIYHSVTKKVLNLVNIKKSVESPYIADPTASFPIIYAYCDLVEPQIVGHTQAPLLKIIKVEGKDGEVVNAHYTRPHYVPVIRQQFQTIEMILRLHSGDLVPFERGRVIAVLHFRLRQII
ncbi:uncharacterized protein TNCV_2336151 [Trichonephila clavipes]|uniref:Uncharacterized protein n=1 Tax=Trichonephila clavipes TaxID=2585209 RepID=A0A8X6SJI0_TRICX|nr:uncharacterized protein TNCV_2336151 [Trichonephila clavipes]